MVPRDRSKVVRNYMFLHRKGSLACQEALALRALVLIQAEKQFDILVVILVSGSRSAETLLCSSFAVQQCQDVGIQIALPAAPRIASNTKSSIPQSAILAR